MFEDIISPGNLVKGVLKAALCMLSIRVYVRLARCGQIS